MKDKKVGLAAVIIIIILVFALIYVLPKYQIKTEIHNVVGTFDAKDPASFDNVQQIIDMGESAIPTLLEMLKSDMLYDRWAAVTALYAIGLEADSETQQQIAKAVKELLDDSNPTIRVLAADTILAFGDKDGAQVLINHLDSKEIMAFMDPPTAVNEFCYNALKVRSGKDYGYDVAAWEAEFA